MPKLVPGSGSILLLLRGKEICVKAVGKCFHQAETVAHAEKTRKVIEIHVARTAVEMSFIR